MKANARANTFYFNTVALSTASITSGIMICHPFQKPGSYRGSVFKKDKEIGSFTIVCREDTTETQADIDLYKIETDRKNDCDCKNEFNYNVLPGGFAIFYASFGEGGYQVTLFGDDNTEIQYTTTKLQRGDIVLAMPVRPGRYEMVGSRQQAGSLFMNVLQNADTFRKTMSEPVNITLNDTEFSNREVKLAQGQSLVISFETDGGLDIKLSEATEVTFDRAKKHHWENPRYK